MRVSFRTTVRTNHHHRRTQILHEMPAGAGDGEDVRVGAYIAKNLEVGVVLEKQIHFYTDAAYVLEHIGKLHVLRV